MRRVCAIAAVVAAVFMGGCRAPAPAKAGARAGETGGAVKPSGEVLARVGGTVITDTMLEEKINSFPPQMTGRFQSASGKKNLLQSMVDLEVLNREAQKEGLDKDKEMLGRLDEYKKKLVADKLREQFLKMVTVNDAEVREEYEKQKERYITPKRVKVSQILFTWDKNVSEKDISAVEKDAQDILERAKKGEDFAELAKKYSLDQATAKRGGDIGYASKHSLPGEVYDAAMTLEKEGDVSGLVKSKDDIRILKATEVVPEKKKPFEEVKPWLERSTLSRKQREAWLKYTDELKKANAVTIYEDKIISTEKTGPPAKGEGMVPMQLEKGQPFDGKMNLSQ
ncbi:MAG: peptidylprolyl isomerase [Candidatus Aureabacteria bacterium]|nr:peptidylprolyl isomerase [Candidatus Auribacterota bacterium]